MQFRYGADPEVFVCQKETRKPIPAHNLIQGTKKHPYPVRNGAVQVDGLALEFNIKPVTSATSSFFPKSHSVMDQLQSMLPPHLTFSTDPVVDFDMKDVEALPQEALQLGCDPDMNAWTMEPNPAPEVAINKRCVAGHIHVGWWRKPIKDKQRALLMAAETAQQLDMIVGLASVILDRHPRSVERRSMYGKAGAFRAKPYGMEYRVLSNFWIFDPNIARLVGTLTELSMFLLANGTFLPGRSTETNNIQYAINFGVRTEASHYFAQHVRNYLPQKDLEFIRNYRGKP